MIWQIHLVIFVFGMVNLHQSLRSVSPISAVLATLTWGYLAVQAGSIQVVTNAGVEVNVGYESLAIYYGLLALSSIIIAIWAFAEETEETIPDDTASSAIGRS